MYVFSLVCFKTVFKYTAVSEYILNPVFAFRRTLIFRCSFLEENIQKNGISYGTSGFLIFDFVVFFFYIIRVKIIERLEFRTAFKNVLFFFLELGIYAVEVFLFAGFSL